MKGYNITYEGWKPEEQKLREALCTLANGYMAVRGAAEEASADDVNYPGTYLAGGYNRATTRISGENITNEDFVNFPNWLCLTFKPEGGKWLSLQEMEVLQYKQTLDMKQGVLVRDFKVKDQEGRITHILSRRFVSMYEMHKGGIQWHFLPENWSGRVYIKSALNGTVKNAGVPRYQDLESNHLNYITSNRANKEGILLLVETRQSKIRMAQTARTRIFNENQRLEVEENVNDHNNGYIEQCLVFDCRQGEQLTIEKIVAVYTSRDPAITESTVEACKNISRAGNFDELLLKHARAWARYWHRADLDLRDGNKTQVLLRLHIFHLLQTVSLNSIGLDVGVPSRGLHGEAYRGHIFWDELFIFPFLNLRYPELTRSLLLYRYRRLEEARYLAREAGCKGAMFPWQSGSNGREESQVIHLNPKSGNWIPDDTHLQRHINAAIAYNVWFYFEATDDRQFLSHYGAEIFLSIALFWGSKAEYNQEKERYEICNVVGPDEYHTNYPDSDEPGLNNNAYTNIMAAWVLQRAIDLLGMIESSRKNELLAELEITEEDIERWNDISERMYVPFIQEGIISQFEGYEQLEEFPWEKYKAKYEDISRLDRVLEKEGDNPNRYKAGKQADVLMLFYLFSVDELQRIFTRLGYSLDEDWIIRNIKYYRDRTSHGSTLSRLVFSWVLSRYNLQESWEKFEQLLISDFEDIQGGTTPEGIHLGAMAGSVDLIQRCYSGLEIREDGLWITPNLPKYLKEIKTRVQYRGHWIALHITHELLKIEFEEGWTREVQIGILDKLHTFQRGDVREFSLKSIHDRK